MQAVVVRQSKPWRRKDGVYLYFEDNAGKLCSLLNCYYVAGSGLIRGFNRGDYQSKGRNEGERDYGAGGQGGGGVVAENC